MLFPSFDAGPDAVPAVVRHNAPGRYRPITDAIARLLDLQVRSEAVASQFDERFSSPAEAVSAPGQRLTGTRERAKAMVFAGLSPLL